MSTTETPAFPTLIVREIAYHRPGWIVEGPPHFLVDADGEGWYVADEFMVWGPNERRTGWAACWSPSADDRDPKRGFFATGATAAEVLTAFNRPSAFEAGAALRAAVEAWHAEVEL